MSLATGAMAFTPTGAWIYLVACRFVVGFGVTGLYSVDITLMQEFSPASFRGWFTGITTTMLPAGSLLAALLGAFAAPISAGADWWRSVCCRRCCAFMSGLSFRNRRIGCCARAAPRRARKSLAWALARSTGASITLPVGAPPNRAHAAGSSFSNTRAALLPAACTGLTQTGGVALALWMVTLFVMVLKIPPEASKLVIRVGISAIAGRFFCSWMLRCLGAPRLRHLSAT